MAIWNDKELLDMTVSVIKSVYRPQIWRMSHVFAADLFQIYWSGYTNAKEGYLRYPIVPMKGPTEYS